MTLIARNIFPAVVLLLLLLVDQTRFVVCYIKSLSLAVSRSRRDASFQLQSSPNIFLGLTSTSSDDDDNDDREPNKEKKKNKVEFVDFWGTKINSIDENETDDPRKIPCVPTLDVRDGPLPRGAYVLEGKQEFDAKSTCRIAIDVKAGNIDSVDDANTIIRRLQACIDAGLDTFQLHDQNANSLAIIRRMNENTPSYINKHWSVDLKIQSITPDSNTLSPKADLRQTILDLVEQTGGDALDSLKIGCDHFPTKKPMLSDEFVLETFEHLVDLQREGWIRSIGVRDTKSEKLRRDVMNYFGDHIDFEEQEGNLLLPTSASDLFNTQNNLRMSSALAGGLLTDLYNSDLRRRKIDDPSSSSPPPLLTNDDSKLLNEWAKRRGTEESSGPVFKQYLNDVVGQLSWIAMKHDVSILSVALRWALECGGSTAVCGIGEGPVVSSALAEIDFQDPKGDFSQKLIELRQVFRFRLDEEDGEILSEISPRQHDNQNGEEGFPDIDFNNPALWL